MKKIFRHLFVPVAAAMLAGCSTAPTKPADTEKAPDKPAVAPAVAEKPAPAKKRGMVLSVKIKSEDRRNPRADLAVEYLRAALTPYAGIIRVFNPYDLDTLAKTEAPVPPDTLVTITLLSIGISTARDPVTRANITQYSQNALVRLTSMQDGTGIAAFEVHAEISDRRAAGTKQRIDWTVPLLKSLMEQAAEKLVAKTSRQLNVGISGPEGDTAFNAGDVLLYLDDNAFENGDRVPFGEYTLRAECDGYRPVTRRIRINSRRLGKINLTFEKVDNGK